MRKFIFAAAVGTLLSTAAFADDAASSTIGVSTSCTSLSDFTEGYYVVQTKFKGTEGTLYQDGTYFKHNGSVTYANVTEASYVWYITKTDNGYILQNASTGNFFPGQNGQGNSDNSAHKNLQSLDLTVSNAALLVPDSTNITSGYAFDANAFTLHQNAEQYKFNNNPIYIHANGDASAGSASYWNGGAYTDDTKSIMQFAFHKLTDTSYSSSKITPAYAVKLTNSTDNTVSFFAKLSGANMEEETANTTTEASYWWSDLKDKITVNETTKTVSANNATFTGTASTIGTEGNVPFDTEKWYTVKFRNDDAKGMVHVSGDNISSGTTFSTITDATQYKGGIWKFEKSGFGVKIKNYDGKYVYVSSTVGGTKATLADEGTLFVGLTNSSGGFTLKVPGATAVIGDHASSCLGIWNTAITTSQNDGGSGFTITEIDPVESYKTVATNFVNSVTAGETYTGDNFIAFYGPTESNLSAAKTALQSATSIDDFGNAVALASKIEDNVDETAYYRIYGQRTDINKKYITSASVKVTTDGAMTTDYDSDNARRVTRVTSDGALVPQLWQIKKTDSGLYKFLNVNTGACLGGTASDGSALDFPTSNEWSKEFGLSQLSSSSQSNLSGEEKYTTLHITLDGQYINMYGGSNNNIMAVYNDETDKGGFFKFEKVTSVPVTIGTTGYTTVCYPFAVTIPDGVEAYYGTTVDSNSMLQLQKVDGGTIPAGEGVILYKQGGGEVSLPIATATADAVTSLAGNLLKGATAARYGFSGSDTYGLGKSGESVSFLLNEMTHVPANKAYLVKTSASTASAIGFSFGTTDGIGSATTESEAAPTRYYDLNGRLVSFPVHGVFVTNTGKKVLVP